MNINDKVLLAKCVGLLYNESVLKGDDSNEHSCDLVRSIVGTIQVNDLSIGINTDRDTTVALKELVLYMCEHSHEKYDEFDLLQRVRLCCANNDTLYNSIVDGIMLSHDSNKSKKYVISTHKYFQNYLKQVRFYEIVNSAVTMYKFHREKIKDFNEFVGNLIAELEPLQMDVKENDPAVIKDIDLGDEVSVRDIFKEIRQIKLGDRIYKTGWQGLNRMLQGGFRPGETVVVGALQHKYKTGFTLSVFEQIALYNKPLTVDPNKKPLLLRISFEDDLRNNIEFLYQKLYFDEHGEVADINSISEEHMAEYVKTKLQVNGFNIKFLRVDPTQWTYKHILNKIIEFETKGYNIEVLCLDYLAMLPTVGCVQGPAGVDIRDLFRRVRNFCAPRSILFITPHQLSTEAKGLIRSGLPEDQFVNEISEKGYYSGSKQIDQEVDVELYIHLFKHKVSKETYFTIRRGKHRITSIIDEDDKYMVLKFPRGAPIPDDLMKEDSSYKKVPVIVKSNASEDMFKLG